MTSAHMQVSLTTNQSSYAAGQVVQMTFTLTNDSGHVCIGAPWAEHRWVLHHARREDHLEIEHQIARLHRSSSITAWAIDHTDGRLEGTGHGREVRRTQPDGSGCCRFIYGGRETGLQGGSGRGRFWHDRIVSGQFRRRIKCHNSGKLAGLQHKYQAGHLTPVAMETSLTTNESKLRAWPGCRADVHRDE